MTPELADPLTAQIQSVDWSVEVSQAAVLPMLGRLQRRRARRRRAAVATVVLLVGAGGGARFRDGVEHRQPQMHGAALAGRSAADDLGAVFERLLRMERAILAGEALGDDFGVGVDEDGHVGLSPK